MTHVRTKIKKKRKIHFSNLNSKKEKKRGYKLTTVVRADMLKNKIMRETNEEFSVVLETRELLAEMQI